jgi:hypothetical protein
VNIYDVVNTAVSYKPLAIDTFNGQGIKTYTGIPVHHVSPHYVSEHFRQGKYISGYWRDGDGNIKVNTYQGYYARNPGATPVSIALGGRKK